MFSVAIPGLPTSACMPAQPVPIQAPPPAPTITVEDTDTMGTLSVDDFWLTAPVQSESPRVRIADSGEDEPGLSISLIDHLTTLLPDEKPADTVGEQAKTEEETSGGTLERPCHTVIMDTLWYRKHILSAYEEQPVTYTSMTSNGFQPSMDYEVKHSCRLRRQPPLRLFLASTQKLYNEPELAQLQDKEAKLDKQLGQEYERVMNVSEEADTILIGINAMLT
ncbi:hypothetical protein EV421DRAFT_1914965 [Armillaria borealis]|uniref:Uncharacterized protein n=1 Tax=Armillaria borealis TaxID=47425 RepID=A0AA39IEP8_9AGAR|nr:hypothetical protein EV421DRAFT_1914965 [Armillaria borealis]